MSREVINVGAAPNDGTGDPIRTAYIKCNNNFGELYSRAQVNPPVSLVGTVGDLAGMYAYDSSFFYYCFQDYDGSSVIWAKITNQAIESYANIVNGNSTVSIPSANSNVVVSVNQTSNVAVFSTSGLTVSNLVTNGNATVFGDLTVYGNANLSGNIVGDRIVNGNSSVEIPTANGNITLTVNGTSNLVVFSDTSSMFSGNVLPSANITYNLGATDARWKDLWLSNSSIYLGNITVAATATQLTVDGNTVITQTANNEVVLGNVETQGITMSANTRLRGDFTSPFPTRTAFQTSDYSNNSPTFLSVLPGTNNGNILGAAFGAWNNIDVANAAVFGLYSYTDEARIQSLPFGTANIQPLTIHMGLSEVFRVTPTGNVGMGNAAPIDRLSVDGNTYISNNITAVGNVTGNIVLSSTYIATTPVAYASLPAAATAGSGARAFITDGDTTTFAANVAGGGGNAVPVYSDGSVWKVG